ncbi:MAG: cytidine deaminase [Actinomycetaceae bacterium]|nr:cytidine deaminase [Actinomycetaceae bacterium]
MIDEGGAPTTPPPADLRDSISPQIWAILHETACEAMECAYAPYSDFQVGAAALVNDGRIVSGCNVENAGYGVTLCAECGLISELVRTGGGKLAAFVCVDKNGSPCAPCGRCRQLLNEHSLPTTLLAMPDGIMTMEEVLPGAFGPNNLHPQEK